MDDEGEILALLTSMEAKLDRFLSGLDTVDHAITASLSAVEQRAKRDPDEPRHPVTILLSDIELGALDVYLSVQPEPRPTRKDVVREALNRFLAQHD